MISCVSVENMRESDRLTIEGGTPSRLLMYRAASGVFRACAWQGRILIAAGGGNNGGDGFALGCILADNGIACEIVTASERLSPDGKYYAELARKKGVKITPFSAGTGCFADADIIVDCLLGTGFSGELRGPCRNAVTEINLSGAFTVSVDINSGMNGDTGEGETAVFSDLTVTVGIVKKGLVAPAAGKYIRRLVCADIGIPPAREEYFIADESEWKREFDGDAAFIRRPDYLDMNIIDVTK